MKKFLSCISAVAIFVLGCFSFAACGSGDGNDASDLDGKYYSVSNYEKSERGEKGYVVINGNDYKLCLEYPVFNEKPEDMIYHGTFDFSKSDGNFIVDSRGMSWVVSNGTIVFVTDGIYIFCKKGATQADIYKGCDGKSGKYYLYRDGGDALYNSNDYIAVVNNAYIAHIGKRQFCGKVTTEGNSVEFENKWGYDISGTFDGNRLALSMPGQIYSSSFHIDDDETADRSYCKVGYTPSGEVSDGDGVYEITVDLNGGYIRHIYPTTAATKNGKLDLTVSEGYDALHYEYIPTPSRRRHTFIGYSLDKEGNTPVTANTVFTADTVIYAQWEEETYD